MNKILAYKTKREFKQIVKEAWTRFDRLNIPKHIEKEYINISNDLEMTYGGTQNINTVFIVNRNDSWNKTIQRANRAYDIASQSKENDDRLIEALENIDWEECFRELEEETEKNM